MNEYLKATLELHARLVRDAEDELDRARDGLYYWIGEAILRDTATMEELVHLLGEEPTFLAEIVTSERRRNRHTALPKEAAAR